MPYSSEVKASIIEVAGKIAVEYIKQHRVMSEKGDVITQLDAVVRCFKSACEKLETVIPEDVP